MWQTTVEHTKPKMACPMKKGVYRTENVVFDLSAMLLFPVNGWYWKITIDVYDGKTGKKILCIYSFFNLQVVKV